MSFTPEQRETIARCKRASLDSTLAFGEIVGILSSAGIESYHADYRNADTTYYRGDGAAESLELPQPDVPIGATFDSAAVRDAIVRSQRGELSYPAFIRATRAAGCAGYQVFLAGRQVQYYGRRGEQHTERFPD